MAEAVIANLALTLRVCIVGGFLIILPRITRKGLLFGAYIGEATADGEEAGRLRGGWALGCVMLMVLSLLVGYGMSLAGQPLAGNFTGTGVLLAGALVLYIRFHYLARKLAPPAAAQQAEVAVAPLGGGDPQGAGLAKLALGLCLLTSLAVYAYAVGGYQDKPEMSFPVIISLPSANLALTPFFALLALLTANAKRSLRGGWGGRSAEAQEAFRATFARVFIWMAFVLCAYLTVLSVRIIRIAPADFGSLGGEFWLMAGLLSGALVVFFAICWIVIIRHGQGGALREAGSVDAPLTDGLADNEHWLGGIFFVDRADPSIMVEKRFGLGYTLNYGNPTAILIVAGFFVLSAILIALAVVGSYV